MAKTLETKYNHEAVEKDKYQYWLEQECFKSGDKTKKPFTIVIPPPNVTGKLHLGHAWNGSIQDAIIRRKKMQGFDTLWLPGMDHAGIATQAKIDEKLKSQGKSRHEMGREKFLEVAWQWKDEYSALIRKQWAGMGLALDYNKERFTLDQGLNDSITDVFIKLYEKGMIYRGNRIINWDVEAKTALSNIEVEYKEVKGHLYYLKYLTEDKKDFLPVATTRPETIFADTALLIHPKDKRYKKFTGKKVYIPGTDRLIPIISDDYVDMSFGTGCVKVTPAHDPNDFIIGEKYKLDKPLCMDESGFLNELAGVYKGLERFKARTKLITDLEKNGLVIKIEEHIHNVGHSERTNAVIEPRMSLQWFVKMDGLAKNTLEKHTVQFLPNRFIKIFTNWMTDIQDWCISRQLWWGHRIPAYYKGDEVVVSKTHPGEGYTQDEDVLDTWFSSALWPFSTLGWPSNTEDLKRYYPTDILVTAYDIIFFWVARMIFQGIEFTGQSPFKVALIHGLIRDANGQKMTKSIGNVVDPRDVQKQYGTDALRHFLLTGSALGADLRYEEEKVAASWNFINKLWNTARYVFLNVDDMNIKKINFENLSLSAKATLQILNRTLSEADYYFEKYEFGEAGRIIYNFMWDDFASWFLELSKIDLLNSSKERADEIRNSLLYILDTIIKLLHPFIPFVTEEISLQYNKKPLLSLDWPKVITLPKDDSEAELSIIKEIITTNRVLRNEKKKPFSVPLSMLIYAEDAKTLKTIKDNIFYLERMCRPEKITFSETGGNKADMLAVYLKDTTVYYYKSELADPDQEIRIKAEIERLNKEILRSETILANKSFLDKAPTAKVEEEKRKLAEYKRLKLLNEKELVAIS
ncbi:MAG: valine--tRNA ligase [Erysipelotrichales bacterium]|nr:valine--tRNA ligase [Erysipelotrichales bacterium]